MSGIQSETGSSLSEVLGNLSEKERKVLELRFGLDDDEPRTLREIGEALRPGPGLALQTVMGGVAAYALFAFAMASVYHGLDLLSDGRFLDGAASAGDYTYFSFVTLTTLGYGDITPATEIAKRLAVVEAFVGQVFVITLVARLVSLWGKPLRS